MCPPDRSTFHDCHCDECISPCVPVYGHTHVPCCAARKETSAAFMWVHWLWCAYSVLLFMSGWTHILFSVWSVCVFLWSFKPLFHFRLCCITHVPVACYLCIHMVLHRDSVWSHVISLKACKRCNMLHRNFNNVLEHIRVLVREAADWLCLAHVFWCFL